MESSKAMQPALCRGSIMHARHIIIPQERKAVKCSAVDLSIFAVFTNSAPCACAVVKPRPHITLFKMADMREKVLF